MKEVEVKVKIESFEPIIKKLEELEFQTERHFLL